MNDEHNRRMARRRVEFEPLVYADSPANMSDRGQSGNPQDQKTGFDLRVDPKDDAANDLHRATTGYSAERTRSSAADSDRVSKEPRSKTRELLSWILSIGLAVIAAFAIRGFIFEIILVDGESMEPTLHTDERIGIEKVTRYSSLPDRGDIIIVKYPNMDGTYVKRVIGLPGETVQVLDSTVYIDGVPLEEDYVSADPYADMDPVIVAEDSVFVMGDNRAHSMDSRASYIGSIPRSDIIGHGLFVMWPLDNMHMIDHADFD